MERQETISNLVHMLKHPFINAFTEIYSGVQKVNTSNRFVLREFQEGLKDVSTWTGVKKDEETVKRFECVKEVSKGLTELAGINRTLLNRDSKEMSVREFLYTCFLNLAREIWTKPFLFYHRVTKSEYQKNMMAIEKLVVGEIKATIRRIPVVVAESVVATEEAIVASVVPAPAPAQVPTFVPALPIPTPVPVVCDSHRPKTVSIVSASEPEPEHESDSESESESQYSETESDSDSSDTSKSYTSEHTVVPKVKTFKVPIKKHHKFRENAMDVYSNYLNPMVFKPPRRRVR